jgi:hypothetical protein
MRGHVGGGKGQDGEGIKLISREDMKSATNKAGGTPPGDVTVTRS